MNSLIHLLTGSWFICYSNFPMWTNGKKTDPTFNYALSSKRGERVLFDEVKYLKHGKPKSIKGVDYPDETDSTAFTWRGKGVMKLLKSKWSVLLIDPNGRWAVIHFSKTFFTPEGIDIISRDRSLAPQTLQLIHDHFNRDILISGQLKALKKI